MSNRAPIAAITPATMKSSPIDFIANAGHTRSPTTLLSVRPGPRNWVCFWCQTSARCTDSSAMINPGISKMCTGYSRPMMSVPGHSPPKIR